MIKRIRILGYKSFRDLSLELRPLTVIFGPNGSGKSNFLDALYFLSRAVNEKNLREAFKGHRGLPLESFYYGDEGYEANLKKSALQFKFEVDVELSHTVIRKAEERAKALSDQLVKVLKEVTKSIGGTEEIPEKEVWPRVTQSFLRYCLTIEASPETGHLGAVDEGLYAIKRNGELKKRRPFLYKEKSELHVEGFPFPVETEPDHTIISAAALFEPHAAAFPIEIANWYTYYLEPRILMREDVPLADIEVLGARGENLAAFLNTLKHKYEKDFDSFNLALKLLLPTRPTVEIERDKEGRVALRIHENGLWFSSRLISEGTLRIIGLLAAIHPRNPATVVAFEEPENGVHPARLKLIAEALKNAAYEYGKQIIVTTHSPFLIEYFDVKDLFVCYREGKQSTIKPFLSYAPDFKGRRGKRALADKILRGDFGR